MTGAKGQYIVDLVAVIDDSASERASELGDRRLFLAGYIARLEDWDSFSAEWLKALRTGRAVKYLKMNEANN